jgi:hypothetical protein
MVKASSHVLFLSFSFWWIVPKGYIALELDFVSARTINRHHHQFSALRTNKWCIAAIIAYRNILPTNLSGERFRECVVYC